MIYIQQILSARFQEGRKFCLLLFLYSVGHKNRPLRLCCLYCICTPLIVQAISHLNNRYVTYRMKPKPNKCAKILRVNIIRYKQSIAVAYFHDGKILAMRQFLAAI